MGKKAFTQVSPRYEIVDNEEKFQVSIDVPGVKMEDIHVSLEDNAILQIKGSRAVGGDGNYSYTSQFSQSFSVDPTIDVEKFSASLNNGVLVISAPKDLKKIEDNIRKIPITEATERTTTDESELNIQTESDSIDSVEVPHAEAEEEANPSPAPESAKGDAPEDGDEPTSP